MPSCKVCTDILDRIIIGIKRRIFLTKLETRDDKNAKRNERYKERKREKVSCIHDKRAFR